MNILTIDAGNTRIKWGLHADGAWREQAWTETIRPQLEAQWSHLPQPDRIVASNVAGLDAANAIRAACLQWNIQPHMVSAQAAQCGVRNGYAEPAQLGTDRWAAMIAARHLHPGRDLLVVQSGTAATIDMLEADGNFRGGLILPGMELMLHALASNTAGLARQHGKLAAFPDNTADAMYSGAVNAITGAVERSYRQLSNHPLCLLSGGDVDILLPLLSIPAQKADKLVLQGLLRIALEP